jgi:hypothetical protein
MAKSDTERRRGTRVARPRTEDEWKVYNLVRDGYPVLPWNMRVAEDYAVGGSLTQERVKALVRFARREQGRRNGKARACRAVNGPGRRYDMPSNGTSNNVVLDLDIKRKVVDLVRADVPVTMETLEDRGLFGILKWFTGVPTRGDLERLLEAASR